MSPLVLDQTWQGMYKTLGTCGHMKSRDKLKTLYLQHRNAYDHQTCQGGDMLLGVLTQKFA